MAGALPPLPELPIDAALEVCTHSSLSALGFPDNSKLAVVGFQYAKASICHVLLATHPSPTATEIEVSVYSHCALTTHLRESFKAKSQQLLDNAAVLHLVGVYDLARKLRTAVDVRQEVLGSLNVSRFSQDG